MWKTVKGRYVYDRHQWIDMILDITWLSKYHAVIDCRNKSVIFRIPHQSEFQFIGESKASRQKQQGDMLLWKLKRSRYR